MPRISDYSAPDVENSVPLEVSGQRIAEAGAVGRSIRGIGQQVEEASTMFYNRQAQLESSNAQVAVADQRAEYQQKLNDQVQSGNVDIDKLKSDFQDDVDEQSDNFQTAHGRNLYAQQSARTQAMLVRGAIHAKSVLAGHQAVANEQEVTNTDSNAIYDNPENFMDIYHSRTQALDSHTSTGLLPANLAPQLKQAIGKTYAESAVKGTARLDPDKAQALLDKGAFKSFFDSNDTDKLQTFIDARRRNQEVADMQSDRLQEKAKKARSEAWTAKNFEGIYTTGDLPVSEIEDAVHKGILTPEQGKEHVRAIDITNREEAKPNWPLFNQLQKQVANREITDENDIRKHYGEISGTQVKDLISNMDNTEEGKILNTNRKTLYKMAETLRFKDPMTNQGYSPIGEERFGRFKTDLLKAEQTMRKAGKPIDSLYDRTSPDYFGNKINSYAVPLAQRFTQGAQNLNEDALKKTEQAKKPGEGIMDNLKRNGDIK